MKISTLFILLVGATFFCSCSDKPLVINDLKNSGSTIYIKKAENKHADQVIIYNLENNFSQLSARPVVVEKPSGRLKNVVVDAFIHHSDLIKNGILLQLIKIEELGDEATFYISFNDRSDYPNVEHLVKEALEMTLLRNLKTNNFSIVFSETADL